MFAGADAADKGKFYRGLVKVDAEIQAEEIQFESLFAPYGDA